MSTHADASKWWEPADWNDIASDWLDGYDIPTQSGTRITGTSQADILIGSAKANTIEGRAGDDVIDGRRGADKMLGGTGNDTYVVDNTGDRVTEKAGQGNDTVLSSVSVKLGANVETLTLTGTKGLSGTGNASDNSLIGNLGNNRLSGGDGNDLLVGGSGRDTLSGGAGNDTLAGGIGKDTLTGGGGADHFSFASTIESTRSSGDVITDFSRAQGDLLDFSPMDANIRNGLKNNDTLTYIGEDGFHGVAGELRHETKGSSTIVSADVDGDGSADMSVTLQGVTDISRDYFLL